MNTLVNGQKPHDVWVRNQAKWGPKELDPYRGQRLAWTKEGDRILFHHADLGEVVRLVEGSGRRCEDCVFDQIPADCVAESIL